MANYTVEAIILRRSDFGEKDRLVTLLSPNRGKIRAIAKGVRRPGSKMAGHLELFAHSKVFLAEGRNLDIITQVQTLTSNRVICNDLCRISWTYYIAELIDKLVAEKEENYALFRLFVSTLGALNVNNMPEAVISNFEINFLGLLGYEPNLISCHICGRPLDSESEFGTKESIAGLLCPSCTRGRSGHLFEGDILAELRRLQTRQGEVGGLLLEVEQVSKLRSVLLHMLQHVAERPIKSASFVHNIQKMEAAL